jgi:hypothetical protein
MVGTGEEIKPSGPLIPGEITLCEGSKQKDFMIGLACGLQADPAGQGCTQKFPGILLKTFPD